MARKKKEPVQDVPVDKIDAFMQKNYKKLITAFACVFIVMVGTYAYFKISASKQEAKINSIGIMEVSGLFTEDQIDKFSESVENFNFASNYIHMVAGISYEKIGNNEKALKELAKVKGDLSEYAKSLSYDLDKSSVVIDKKMLTNSPFDMIWDYRAILAAPEGSREDMTTEFIFKYPNNELTELLLNWRLK